MRPVVVRGATRGFTLVELMVVVAIMGVMAMLAGPSLLGLRDRLRTQAWTGDVQSLFQIGRTEAIRSARRYVVILRSGTVDRAALFYFDGTGPSAISAGSLSDQQLDGTANPPAGLVLSRTVTRDSNMGFGPPAGYSAAFTGPFVNVPRTAACTFCAGANGAVYFESDGAITLSDGGVPVVGGPWAGSITVSPRADWASGRTDRQFAVTFVAMTGAINVWH